MRRSKGAQLTLPVLSRWPSMRAMSPTMPTRSVPPDLGCCTGWAAAAVLETEVDVEAELAAELTVGFAVAGADDGSAPEHAASKPLPAPTNRTASARRRCKRNVDSSLADTGDSPLDCARGKLSSWSRPRHTLDGPFAGC